MRDRPSVLVVVQRYGDVSGGAEAHARELVAHLRPHADLAVATTTAADYRTWTNVYTAGIDAVDGVAVHRFPVESGRTRDFRLRAACEAVLVTRGEQGMWLSDAGAEGAIPL